MGIVNKNYYSYDFLKIRIKKSEVWDHFSGGGDS